MAVDPKTAGVWKGRFRKGLDPEAMSFSSSLAVDRRLFHEDIEGSIAHAVMLARQKIISGAEARKIERALREIEREIEAGKLGFEEEDGRRFVVEDIHMAIEQRLIEKLGDLGGKIHTARSRNDQIALDERLYLRKAIDAIIQTIRRLQKVCVATAEQYRDVIIPGYTHLQPAQPIFLAHHLLAYVSMVDRDCERFEDCLRRVNRSPLGAGALGGTSFPIDRGFVARRLGFRGVIDNSIDAVSDRDVHIEFLAACAVTMMHLSRLAGELVLWSSREWGFADIGEEFMTGSSIMPQKKNPDIAELVRGKTGRVYGNLMSLLVVMKGLPLAYNRDMQEDKEPLFDSADTVARAGSVLASMMKSVRFRPKTLSPSDDFLFATDLADYLVRKGMPFRNAHSVVGSIVRFCLNKGVSLKNLPLEEYRRHSRLITQDVFKLFDPMSSVSLKKSRGSTSPSEVKKAIRFWKKKLG